MKTISGNLGGTVDSRYIADIATSGGGSASSPSVIAYNYKSSVRVSLGKEDYWLKHSLREKVPIS